MRWALFGLRADRRAGARGRRSAARFHALELSGADAQPVPASRPRWESGCSPATPSPSASGWTTCCSGLVLIGRSPPPIGIVEFACRRFDYRASRAARAHRQRRHRQRHPRRLPPRRRGGGAPHRVRRRDGGARSARAALRPARARRGGRRRSAVRDRVAARCRADDGVALGRSSRSPWGWAFYVRRMDAPAAAQRAGAGGASAAVCSARVVPGLLGTLRSLMFIGSAGPQHPDRQDGLREDPRPDRGSPAHRPRAGHLPAAAVLLPRQPVPRLADRRWSARAGALVDRPLRRRHGAGARAHASARRDPATRSLGQALAGASPPWRCRPARSTRCRSGRPNSSCSCLLGCAGSLWSMERSRERGEAGGSPASPRSPGGTQMSLLSARQAHGRAEVRPTAPVAQLLVDAVQQRPLAGDYDWSQIDPTELQMAALVHGVGPLDLPAPALAARRPAGGHPSAADQPTATSSRGTCARCPTFGGGCRPQRGGHHLDHREGPGPRRAGLAAAGHARLHRRRPRGRPTPVRGRARRAHGLRRQLVDRTGRSSASRCGPSSP